MWSHVGKVKVMWPSGRLRDMFAKILWPDWSQVIVKYMLCCSLVLIWITITWEFTRIRSHAFRIPLADMYPLFVSLPGSQTAAPCTCWDSPSFSSMLPDLFPPPYFAGDGHGLWAWGWPCPGSLKPRRSWAGSEQLWVSFFTWSIRFHWTLSSLSQPCMYAWFTLYMHRMMFLMRLPQHADLRKDPYWQDHHP